MFILLYTEVYIYCIQGVLIAFVTTFYVKDKECVHKLLHTYRCAVRKLIEIKNEIINIITVRCSIYEYVTATTILYHFEEGSEFKNIWSVTYYIDVYINT